MSLFAAATADTNRQGEAMDKASLEACQAAALAEAQAKQLSRNPALKVNCGALVADSDPTGSANLQANLDAIQALALEIQRARRGF